MDYKQKEREEPPFIITKAVNL